MPDMFSTEIQKLAETIGYKPGLVAALVAAISLRMRAPAGLVVDELLAAAERIRAKVAK